MSQEDISGGMGGGQLSRGRCVSNKEGEKGWRLGGVIERGGKRGWHIQGEGSTLISTEG